MKNYNKLVKVIQEAVPEIMELKMGCAIKFRRNGETDFIASGKTGYKERPISTINFGSVRLSVVKSLGRPIRLADVLMAYNEIHDSMSAKRFAIYFNGQVVYWDDDEKAHLECVWNLKDNSLDNQSDETKQFLIDLLVK